MYKGRPCLDRFRSTISLPRDFSFIKSTFLLIDSCRLLTAMTSSDDFVGSVPIEMPRYSACSPEAICQKLHEGKKVHEFIAEHPQAGIYLRFADWYAMCMSYLENEVLFHGEIATSRIKLIAEGRGNLGSADDARSALKELMTPLIESLSQFGQLSLYHQAISQAPSPSSFFLATYHNLVNTGNGSCAPNGLDASKYDPISATSAEFFALDKPNISPLERMLAFRLTEPFFKHVFEPIKKRFNRIAGRPEPSSDDDPVNAKYILMLSRQLTVMFGILVMAVAITTLKPFAGTKAVVPIMTAFALVFASSVQFLGQDSMQMNILVTTFFQTMVFFVSTLR